MTEALDEPAGELDVVRTELSIVFAQRQTRVRERNAVRVDALVLLELCRVLVAAAKPVALGAAVVGNRRRFVRGLANPRLAPRIHDAIGPRLPGDVRQRNLEN